MTGFNSKREAAADKLLEPVNLLEARRIAAEYGMPDSQVDDGNLYFALSKCLEHIDALLARDPAAFAGIEMWVGGARITKYLTQTELHYARDPWMLMQYSAELCLAKLKERNHGA